MLVEAWVRRAARAHPDRPAVDGLTCAGLDAAVEAAARALWALGGRPGQAIGLALAPSTDFAVALHAVHRIGALAVPVDLRAPADRRPAVDLLVEDALGGAPADPDARLLAVHDLDAPAIRVHTSGTTGAPKAVDLRFGQWLWSAIGSSVALGGRPDDRWLCALPLTHVGGLSILMRSAIGGFGAVVHERFEAERVARALHDDAITLVSLVPTTLARVLDAGLRDPPALRCALIGGGPVSGDLMARARAAGVPVAQTYGLTEACSQVTTARPGEGADDAGPPLFCTRVELLDDGEIVVSGPTVAGGRHVTGDLGRLDAEGRLRIVGRKADTIVTGGENVAPAEVEGALEAHPAVLEAAVLGRPDPEWGERVVALVVARPGWLVDPGVLREHVRTRLAPAAVPKEVRIVTGPLPRTRSGKLVRGELGGVR